MLFAIGFLTAWPVRTPTPRPGDLGRAARWFPVTGLALGGLLAGAHLALAALFPPLLTAALTVTLWAALTGGLHLDGLADCGDGLLAAATPERRLEIMRDPRLGAFGGLTLALFLIAKVAAVSALEAGAWLPLALAASSARWLILPMARQPLARPGGMAAEFALGLTPATVGLAALVPAAFALYGLLAEPRVLIALTLAHAVAWLIARRARARLGGVTGDVFGLTVELSELAVLLAFAASWP